MKKILLITAAVLILSIAAAGLYVLRPTQEASAPIQATPIATQNQPPPAIDAETTAEPTIEEISSVDKPGLAGTISYQISQADSEVRFSLDEILRGKPFTPVGRTDQVAGEISIDFDRKQAQVGTIQVNTRTLKTDSDFRNRAINNEILDTGDFEFITFTPTEIQELPQEAEIGQEIQFQITGDLTIRDVTNQVTFDVRATLVDEKRLEGHAEATVLRSDYRLIIPSVPSVADVSDEVLLEIDFVALAS